MRAVSGAAKDRSPAATPAFEYAPPVRHALLVVLALSAVTIVSGCAAPPSASAPPSVATPSAPPCAAGRAFVILVRHAEKISGAPDAELSPQGVERAQRLAILLGKAGVTRLVATDVKRTQQTLAPLAERLGLSIDVRPAREVDALARELLASPDGAVVVVAHHSNGVPRLARGLGTSVPGLSASDDARPEDEFGRVIVVSLGCDRSRATAVRLDSDVR